MTPAHRRLNGSGRPLGEQLKAWRTRMGWTQTDLAERLDPPVLQPTVARWESGERRIPPGLWQALETIEREVDGRTAPAGGN